MNVYTKLKIMWDKKIHVKSSMTPKSNQWSLFIGRWQPLHIAHKEMFQQVLNEGGKVLIGIRDIEPDENNPFTVDEIYNNIKDQYKDNTNVSVMIMPDISSVNFGRGVGYDIVEYIPPTELSEISATKIRKELGL
jgi:nicotinamide mononucleotide adenylyltransferase